MSGGRPPCLRWPQNSSRRTYSSTLGTAVPKRCGALTAGLTTSFNGQQCLRCADQPYSPAAAVWSGELLLDTRKLCILNSLNIKSERL